jgi:polyhydroxybutyrate depolymerase
MIGYHGLGLDGTSPRRDHKWPIIEELAGDNGIFIYANSRGQSWNGGTNSEDIKFFDGIVKFMSESYCIDPKRVFVHGFSNGAFFVNSLVKQRQDSIRGVISVAGGGSGTNTAAMVIHGEADPSVGYVYAPSLLRSYASANNCSETLLDAPRETCTTFPSCDEGKPVVFCPWRGNHHWPEFSLTHVWEFIESLK